ncbi:MAG TPA: hypothetical protein VM871_02035 [Flavisolibacter sp.]|jgi:hypothetical protein|nr:hypothetical protein [Flavisolibacter sp.]
MKLFLILGMLCVENFSTPAKEIKTKNYSANVKAKSSFKLAPSILIVGY